MPRPIKRKVEYKEFKTKEICNECGHIYSRVKIDELFPESLMFYKCFACGDYYFEFDYNDE